MRNILGSKCTYTVPREVTCRRPIVKPPYITPDDKRLRERVTL